MGVSPQSETDPEDAHGEKERVRLVLAMVNSTAREDEKVTAIKKRWYKVRTSRC